MVFNRLIKAPVIFIAFLFYFVQTTAFAAPKQVTLQLFWKHQFEFAGYYAAKELGFYEEAGLDVNIREYQLGMDVNEEVLSGHAQFAAVSSSVIKNYLQGKPVKLLANIFKHSALVLLSHRDAGIRTPGDLYGKRLMLTSQERNAVEFLSFFAKNGIDSKKLSYVDHNFDPMATVNGQADVMSAYITNQPFILQQKGIPYNILDPAAYGVDFYGDSLITSAKLSEQRPELVEAFKEASLMGWAYALQHPEEIIELILNKYNTTNKSREALRYEATETAKLILPETYPLGSIDPERVRHIANAMYKAGVIKDKPDIESLIFGPELKSRLSLTQSDIALTDLTLDEQAWLATHKKIVVGGEKDWAPFDFVDKAGKYTGIANDYLKIIGEKLGIEVEVITGPSWNELLSMIRHKEIDVLPAIYHSKEREDYVHYTTSYIRVTEFVFSCSDNKTISNFNDLQDKTIIVVKGYTIEGFLRSNYPEFNLITAPTIQDALKKLITGKADAFINDIISTSYHIKELSLVGIKPIAPIPFLEPTVHMAVRKDWPVLKNLINRILKTITESEHNAIKNHWISLTEKKIEKKLPKVTLTPDEQAWLKNHPVIRVHNEKNWPPFNYFEYGSPRGLSIDYMNLLAELLGLEIEYVTGPSWNEFLGMMRSKELDVMLDIVKTEDRMKYIRYTDPYFRNPNVIVSLQKHSYETIRDLFGKTVVFPKGFFYEEVLTRFFPQIKRLPVEDTLASLKTVMSGKADAVLADLAAAQALINKNMLIGLRISGEVNIGNPDLVNLRIGIRDDWPLLQSAIMKAMAGITPQKMNQLRQKWHIRLTDERAGILLTDAERKWLSEHRDISMGVDPEWPPYDFIDESGKHQGLSADVLALLSERLGIKIRLVSGLNWSQVLDAARTRELDIVSLLSETPKRAEYLKFVRPITRTPWVIVTSKNFRPVTNLGDMTKDRVAMVKDYAIIELGQKSFPDLTVQTVESPLAGLQAVTTGQMDAYVGNLGVVSYLIRQNGLVNLKIAAQAGVESRPFMIGVRSDWPELVTILNKGLSSISQGEMNAIHQKWIPIEMGALTPKATAPVSYGRLIISVIAVFLILSLLVWILIKITKKEDISVSFGSRWFRILVLTGLSIIIIIVCLLSWFTLERNKEKVLASVGESFRMILNTANDKLNICMAQKKSFMKLFGRDPELLSITKRLLAVSPNRDDLLVSTALLDARRFFKNNEKIFANIGFFIINPDHISIGSMRDANVGTQNFISFQRPDLLRRAFQGEVLFVPSIQSNVSLGNSEFFIGPILDLKGHIIAVMALHTDPSKNFSQALYTHGMFKSSETYAINSEGLLLSESRFNDHLRQIGLIEKGQQSALNIEIRDPGVNMVMGHRPIWERSKQPLTHIVSHAIQLKLDMDKIGQHQGRSTIEVNTKVCRDYRGVPVFGAWLWSADLGFGLATKIDADEALSAYHMMRMTVFGILGFTLLLLVGAILFVLILGERASRALIKARDNLEEKVEERTAELRENQERLALAEERSRLLLDSAGEGIFGVDTKGRINFVNPSAVSMLGYPENELIGQEVHQLIHHSHSNSSSYPLENSPIFKVYTDGTSHHEEDEVLRRKDETCFHVEYTATPMKKDGRLAGAVFTFNDTTERKQAQEALRQNMEDLERFSKLTVGREERMIKLKKEINELLRGSGKPDKYKIVD